MLLGVVRRDSARDDELAVLGPVRLVSGDAGEEVGEVVVLEKESEKRRGGFSAIRVRNKDEKGA